MEEKFNRIVKYQEDQSQMLESGHSVCVCVCVCD